MIDLISTVVASPGQISTTLAEDIVILNLENGTYYGLNEVGALIWEALQEPVSVSKLCDIVVATYNVDAERCSVDVLALVRDLEAHGLIVTK